MKRLLLLFVFSVILTAQVSSESMYYRLSDPERLLSPGLSDCLPQITEEVISFATPYEPTNNPAGDGVLPRFGLYLTVRQKKSGTAADYTMIGFVFSIEIIPESGQPLPEDSPISEESPAMGGSSFGAAGAGRTTDEALSLFLDDFRKQLAFELMYRPLVRKDYCVLYMFGNDAVLSPPRGKKARVGQELDMYVPDTEGKEVFSGRLVVTAVNGEYALGRMRYEEKPLIPGAVGRPARSAGLETRVHTGFIIKTDQNAFLLRVTEGFNLPTPWLFPLIGVQIPFLIDTTTISDMPFTFFLGLKVPWFLEKIQLFSVLGGGIGVDLTDQGLFAAMIAEIGVEIKFDKLVSVSVGGGYTGWEPLGTGSALGGFFVGLETCFSY